MKKSIERKIKKNAKRENAMRYESIEIPGKMLTREESIQESLDFFGKEFQENTLDNKVEECIKNINI